MLKTSCSNAQGNSDIPLPPGKSIYIPKDLQGMDLQNPASRWSYHRMAYTENFVIFWEKGFGNDLGNPPQLEGHSMKVDLPGLKEKLENFYAYFYHTLQFARQGSKCDKYRMMVMINYSLEGTAYGGDYDGQIGALWIAPNRVQDKKLNCIAHELGHSFQSQITCDEQGEAWGGCGFFEMTSQWMLWQVNPDWMTDEKYHWDAFKTLTHKAYLHLDNIYHSPYVLEYWGTRHGLPLIAELYRQGKRGEDPVITYKRLNGLEQEEFCDEMFDACRHFVNWDFEIIREGDEQSIHLNRIVPVYGGRMGIAVRRLREIVWETLSRLSPAPEPEVYEFVPDTPCKTALRDLHFPETAEARDRARRRFALEECLAQQLNVAYRRRRADEMPGMRTAGSSHLVKDLADSLPFVLTEAQKRCVREIYRDMKAPRSMNRLLQGDVGSGKTLVALCAMLLAVEHGYSAVMMAPTQILAEQHYLKFRQMLDKLDVPVSLVTAERKEESHVSFGKQGGIVVGTHALLYGKNVPERVGLVVIDEQHKFGVNQREKLIEREERPDVLVMTATPIPRTLTLTFYGELDVSILDGVPGGRGAVVTAIRTEKDKGKVLAFVRNQLEEGRQIYVVSPLIDGEDSRKGKAVTKEWDEWKALLPHVDVGLLHGRMSSEEKEAVMKDFRSNRISVLVSTTVVEVGVDVPNATVMIINNAESFGLSQLHQLRGRIGRGSHKSYCILMTDARPEDEQWEKLRIVETTANGFDLAEQDLRLRGPGDVLGTSQSGLKGVRFEEWLLDARLIHRGRQLAEAILAEDPNLESAKYRPLRFLLEDGAGRRVAG